MMGSRIRLRRKELGFTQIKLAELLDISSNHMSGIENGKERPSLEKFVALCDFLKTTPDFLLMGNIHSGNIPQNITADCRQSPGHPLRTVFAKRAKKSVFTGKTLRLFFGIINVSK